MLGCPLLFNNGFLAVFARSADMHQMPLCVHAGYVDCCFTTNTPCSGQAFQFICRCLPFQRYEFTVTGKQMTGPAHKIG